MINIFIRYIPVSLFKFVTVAHPPKSCTPVADPGFPGGEHQLRRGCANLLFCKIFAENCMTKKEFGPGEGPRPWRPLGSAGVHVWSLIIYTFIIIFGLLIIVIICRDFYNLNFFSYFCETKLENNDKKFYRKAFKWWMKMIHRNRILHCHKSIESTIMLRESSQGESSVMRLRLEGCKKPIRVVKKPLQICTSKANMH